MLTIKEIKPILRKYNIKPNKKLGQNFLIDKNIQEKIIEAIAPGKKDVVLEIGPGLAALTEELCKRSNKVTAIEKDRRLCEFLASGLEKIDNLNLIQGDILKYNFREARHRQLKIVGNLPYYISSPILIHLLDNRDFIDSIFITVQKEYGERLVAKPGSKIYGSISCFAQFYSEPVTLFTIKKGSFYPQPKIDSCFLKISIRKKPLYLTDEEKLFKIIRICFGKRRKMISSSLYPSLAFASKEEMLERLRVAGIDPTQRPETVSLEQFASLASF